MTKHYYILPDGTIVYSMKEGKLKLKKGSDAFRSLVRKGIIKKVVYNQKLHSDDPEALNQKV
jgi:hypothetical protein